MNYFEKYKLILSTSIFFSFMMDKKMERSTFGLHNNNNKFF